MDSYLLRQYISLYGKGLSGAIIIGTGYESSSKILAGLNFCKMMAYFKGQRHRSKIVKKMCLEIGPYKKYDNDMTKNDKNNS